MLSASSGMAALNSGMAALRSILQSFGLISIQIISQSWLCCTTKVEYVFYEKILGEKTSRTTALGELSMTEYRHSIVYIQSNFIVLLCQNVKSIYS